MTYAYDDYVQMPTKDLYDTAVMKMAIEAAKDMYDKGEAQMENFYKTYGDFMSPFAKDMEWYGGEMKRIRDVVNDAYARGIDLFKSPEGRMIVSQLSHSIDPMQYNMARANAKMGYAYLDALQEAKKNGTYDPVYENWMLNQEGGPGSFEDFSTAKKGMWTVPGPSKYQDPSALVSPLFENMKDDYIDTKDGYDYSGVSRDRRALVLQANIGALLKTPNGRYLYELSKAKAEQRLGRTPTETEALSQYENDLLDASNRFEYRTRTENKDWARQRESQLRMKEDTHKTNEQIRAYQEESQFDIDNGISTKKTGSKEPNVYQRTDNNGGGLTVFNSAEDVKEKVTPMDGNIKRFYKHDKESGDMVMYQVPNDLVPRVLYKQNGDKLVPLNVDETWTTKQPHWWSKEQTVDTGAAAFVSTGRMFSQKDKDGKTHYYITGFVSYGDQDNEDEDGKYGTVDCVMEVSRPVN